MSNVPFDVTVLNDEELELVMRHVNTEYHARKLNSNELLKVRKSIEGIKLQEPEIIGDMLVCSGEKIITGKNTHKCSFMQVNNVWVWESELLIKEWIDYVGSGGSLESLTFLSPIEGLVVNKINSLYKNDSHKLVSIETFEIINGELVRTKSTQGRKDLLTSHGL